MISAKKKPTKVVALAVFYTLALALALILILHNNPLEDPHTAMLKKICGCILIAVGSIRRSHRLRRADNDTHQNIHCVSFHSHASCSILAIQGGILH